MENETENRYGGDRCHPLPVEAGAKSRSGEGDPWRTALAGGLFIRALPLTLHANGEWSQRLQQAVLGYSIDDEFVRRHLERRMEE